jgi:hypothetical protein
VEIKTIPTYICIVNPFYFIVVLMARTFCNTTQQDAKHKDIKHMYRTFYPFNNLSDYQYMRAGGSEVG